MVWCGGWWVRVWGDELWHGVLKWGKDGVKDTVTQKQKDPLFPQTSFHLLFSFPKPFPSLSFSCCATIHSLSPNQRAFSSTTHVYTHNEHKTKPTQCLFHFIVFPSCSNSYLYILFFNNSPHFDHPSILATRNV